VIPTGKANVSCVFMGLCVGLDHGFCEFYGFTPIFLIIVKTTLIKLIVNKLFQLPESRNNFREVPNQAISTSRKFLLLSGSSPIEVILPNNLLVILLKSLFQLICFGIIRIFICPSIAWTQNFFWSIWASLRHF
jgi:hypothetical protein